MTRSWLVLSTLAVTACQGGDRSSADAGTNPEFDAGVDAEVGDGEPRFYPSGPQRGEIEVLDMVSSWGASSGDVQAAFVAEPTRMRFVFYGQVAVVHWQQESMRIGDCRLLELGAPFCTDCTGICVDTEVCEPYPEFASAGTLSFDGLSVPLSLQYSGYGYAAQGAVPSPAFEDDATITVSAAGADVPGFEIAARGVPELITEMDIPTAALSIAPGEDLTVTWTPADPSSRVLLRLNANNEGHGNPFQAVIECDVADTGSVTVPHELLAAFPATPAQDACEGSDCPPSELTRYRRATVDVDGADVALVVGSRIEFPIDYRP